MAQLGPDSGNLGACHVQHVLAALIGSGWLWLALECLALASSGWLALAEAADFIGRLGSEGVTASSGSDRLALAGFGGLWLVHSR